ncbi:hypothetical protein Tco_0573172 [Tanacetum coccineum]
MVKPEIRGNVNFEIKSQFMQELREDTFSGNKNEDAHDHVDRVLNIIDSLQELSTVGTSLKKPLSKDIVHHPRPLNDLKTSTTSSRKAMNHYTKLRNGLNTMNRQLLDLHGLIPGSTPTQALTTIQTMADHSQKWHDGISSRNMRSNSNTDGLAAVIRPHLDKEYPLNEEVKQVDEVKYGEFRRPAPFNGSGGAKFRVGLPGYYTRTDNQTPSGEKRPKLVKTINKYMEGAVERQAEQDEWLKTNTNHVKDSELASIFGKLKYEENLIDSIYENEKSKSLVSATPLSTAFFSTSIVQDFQDSPDDEEDTRSSHEYLNDLEEEYQARALLAKSKRDCWSKTLVPSYQSPFQPKLLHSSKHKPESRHTKDFEAKYNKIKAKLALLSSNASAPSSSSCKNKGTCLKKKEFPLAMKVPTMVNGSRYLLKSSGPKDPVFVRSSADNSEVSITSSNKPKLSETGDSTLSNHDTGKSVAPPPPLRMEKRFNKPKLSEIEDSTLSNHDTGKVPSNESHRNTTDHSVVVSDSSATDYDLADESSVYRTPLPLLEKLIGVEPVFGPKTIKSILKSKSTFKDETLKGIIINEPSSAPTRGNKSPSVSKTNSAPAGKLKNVKIEDDPPLAIVIKELNELELKISKNKSSYLINKNSQQIPPNALQNKYKT